VRRASHNGNQRRNCRLHIRRWDSRRHRHRNGKESSRTLNRESSKRVDSSRQAGNKPAGNRLGDSKRGDSIPIRTETPDWESPYRRRWRRCNRPSAEVFSHGVSLRVPHYDARQWSSLEIAERPFHAVQPFHTAGLYLADMIRALRSLIRPNDENAINSSTPRNTIPTNGDSP
jgi:hypothetical protein